MFNNTYIVPRIKLLVMLVAFYVATATSCFMIPNKTPILEGIPTRPFRDQNFLLKKNLSLYTFELKEFTILGDVYGKAFIAEGSIYTARHVVEPRIKEGYDTVSLGCADIHGFYLCRQVHQKNDRFCYVSDRGLIDMWVLVEEITSFTTLCSDNIKPGDSGTPVICEHGNVIGLVSGYYPNTLYESNGGIRGVIAKVPLELIQMDQNG